MQELITNYELRITNYLIYIFIVFLPFSIFGIELMPWFEKNLEIHPRVTYLFQTYDKVDDNKHSSDDHYVNLSLSVAYDRWNGELEVTAGHTHENCFGLDNIRLTGRYLWLNDVVGDYISLVPGITITKAFKPFRRDFSSFHHGGIEVEGHVAFGQETSCFEFWSSRWWGVVAIGVADVGSPWIRGDLAWEKNWWDLHWIRFFLNSLWGLGSDNLKRTSKFRGYGSIMHQSIDVGAKYFYQINCSGILSVGYAYRVHAKNFPSYAHQVILSFMYPFGL